MIITLHITGQEHNSPKLQTSDHAATCCSRRSAAVIIFACEVVKCFMEPQFNAL